ncbi:MAG: hypothetical protein INR64_01465 [Caulobacteraceae bacterium]|nr:hypothetical protein [Caulobacter sp.]
MLLPSCNTPSQAAYERQVNAAVAPGMRADQAEVALARIGFSCFRSGASADDCTKHTADKVIATCIQHVVLHYEPSETRLASVETRPLACVGP